MNLLCHVLLVSAIAATAGNVEPFDDTPAGGLPAGWFSTLTGEGHPQWSVTLDNTAPSKPFVFKQSGTADYSLAIKESPSITNGFVEVKFKPVSGVKDQAAGLVWRYQDSNNYYIARANALENNVVLYKVQNGKRTALDIVGRKGGYGVKVAVSAREWSRLRVEFQGTGYTVFLNGRELFAVRDDSFIGSGRIGLWTKADSVTLFDDFNFDVRR